MEQRLKENKETHKHTILEEEVILEMNRILTERGGTTNSRKNLSLDIELYIGRHSTKQDAEKLNRYLAAHDTDLFADEYVYIGDITKGEKHSEGIESNKITEEVRTLALAAKEAGLEYDRSVTRKKRYIHDVAIGDYLRNQIVIDIQPLLNIENKIFDLIPQIEFQNLCDQMESETEKFRNIQNTREAIILHTFAEKTASAIINHDLDKKDTIKIVLFFGFDHYQFASKMNQIHTLKNIHFQDDFLNNQLRTSSKKAPSFSMGMSLFNSIKTEEDTFIQHTREELDPYRYIAQEFYLRLNSDKFHAWAEQLSREGRVGEIFDNVIKGVDKIAEKYTENNGKSKYYYLAKSMFDEYKSLVS